jgi:hypothetical protein
MNRKDFAAKERKGRKEVTADNVGQCVPPVSFQTETANHATPIYSALRIHHFPDEGRFRIHALRRVM